MPNLRSREARMREVLFEAMVKGFWLDNRLKHICKPIGPLLSECYGYVIKLLSFTFVKLYV